MIVNNEAYRLSICIPTYNQSSSVRRLLDELFLQYVPEIEIIIRDDSTNDETMEMVQRFQRILPIRYYRGQREGLDSAIIFLTNQARGDFVWWIGDDVISSFAVKKILLILNNNNDISFLWINSSNFYDSKQLTCKTKHSGLFVDKNDVLKRIDIGLLGFITATIFKREIGANCLTDAKNYVGSAFVCLYIVLYVISRGGSNYYAGDSFFFSYPKPPGEVRWYDQTQVFGISLFKIASVFKNDFDVKILKNALSKNLSIVLKAIFVERAMGFQTGFAAGNKKIFTLAYIYWNYLNFYKIFPLLILPVPVAKILYKFFKFIRDY